jgi:hypothetical protein
LGQPDLAIFRPEFRIEQNVGAPRHHQQEGNGEDSDG